MSRPNASTLQSPEPMLIGPKNCAPMLGVTWRWLRDHASTLGLELIQIDGKRFVDARAARDAILARREQVVPAQPQAPTDELATLRARLGYRRRSA